MAIPTQFSVTGVRSSPIANPASPQDKPRTIDAENVSLIDGASVLPALSVGGIDAPESYTPESVIVIDAPSAVTPESAANINAPSAVSAAAQPTTDAPVALNAIASVVTNTPVVVVSEAVAGIDTPSALNSQSASAIDTPSAATSQVQPSTDTPSSLPAESVAPISTPTALTANTGTLTTPPFPLKHPRILSSNKLLGYSSVTSDVGGSPLNALIPNTWEKWRPSGMGFYKVVLTSAQPIDTICIGAHNLGSRGITVSPQYRETDTGTLTQFAGARAPSGDSAIMFHRSSTVNAKVIEIYISGGTSAEVGHISAGLALQMQRPIFNGHTPYTDSDVTEYYSNRSESGEIIGRQIRRRGFEATADFQNIDDTWYRVYFAPFKQAIKTVPFYFAWNLDEYPLDVAFAETTGDISASMQNGVRTKRSGLSIPMRGV